MRSVKRQPSSNASMQTYFSWREQYSLPRNPHTERDKERPTTSYRTIPTTNMGVTTTTTTPTGGVEDSGYADDDPNSQEEYRARILSHRTAELMATFKEYVSHDFDDGDQDGDGFMSLTINGTHDDEDVENGNSNGASAVLRGGQGGKGMMVRTTVIGIILPIGSVFFSSFII